MRLEVRVLASEVNFASATTEEELDIIRSLLGDDSDPATQCLFWMVTSNYHWEGGDFESSARAVAASVIHAERSGSRRLIEQVALQEEIASLSGPEPVVVAVAQFEALISAADVSRITKGFSLDRLAILRAMQGRFTEARAQVEEGRRIFEELGSRTGLAELLIDAAWVERLAGDFMAEVRLLREATESCETIGAAGMISFVAARMALAWARLGNVAEARESLAVAGSDPSPLVAVACQLAAARMLAAEDRIPDALERIKEADSLSAGRAAFVNLRTEVQYELAAIALQAHELVMARSAAESGLTLATAKGNVAMADRLSALLVDIAMTQA